ncbi:uncharacterized protein LOC134211863 [Armigeres subalbatus]|uniref:uncharacterized protein LOC134211863 n=1 Tax=Armigeres subalbatus TaxID=124917 RepID=UPI002ED5B52C
MASFPIIVLVFAFASLCFSVHGRPAVDYEYYDNEIADPSMNNMRQNPTSTTGAPVQKPTSTTKPPVEPMETTTEYRYQDIIAPYTVKVPKVESIRHAAGTLYYTVHPDEDSYKKLMEVYEEHFEIPMNRNLPKNVPPKRY